MPLPKAPSKPAQLVDMSTAVLATELSKPKPKPATGRSARREQNQARLLSDPPRVDKRQLALISDSPPK